MLGHERLAEGGLYWRFLIGEPILMGVETALVYFSA